MCWYLQGQNSVAESHLDKCTLKEHDEMAGQQVQRLWLAAGWENVLIFKIVKLKSEYGIFNLFFANVNLCGNFMYENLKNFSNITKLYVRKIIIHLNNYYFDNWIVYEKLKGTKNYTKYSKMDFSN